jgi:hypothetical protein
MASFGRVVDHGHTRRQEANTPSTVRRGGEVREHVAALRSDHSDRLRQVALDHCDPTIVYDPGRVADLKHHAVERASGVTAEELHPDRRL